MWCVGREEAVCGKRRERRRRRGMLGTFAGKERRSLEGRGGREDRLLFTKPAMVTFKASWLRYGGEESLGRVLW